MDWLPDCCIRSTTDSSLLECKMLNVPLDEMLSRLVRYQDLIPCTTAFIDTRTPGSDKKENFTIIGPGVAESPQQHVHVKIPHGFNIGGARQPKGCINSQHSHISEEVFLVHCGEWVFRWGENAEDGEVILRAGDVISIPINVFRGFECVSEEPGFLFAILGRDDPGHVTWAPYVFEQAEKYGLILTKSGRLIDTHAGEVVPEGDEPCAPTTAEEAAKLRRMTLDEMRECVVTSEEMVPGQLSALAQGSRGVQEIPILGPANVAENISAGKVSIPHGFHFRRINLSSRAHIPPHSRNEEEVVFVRKGAVSMYWGDKLLELGAGDTLSVPAGLNRCWRTSDDTGAELFVVRGGNEPKGPAWLAGQIVGDAEELAISAGG